MRHILMSVVILLVTFVSFSQGQEDQNALLKQIKWQRGPCISSLGNEAEINIPAGYIFSDATGTKILMEAMHNIPSDKEVGVIVSTAPKWYLLFSFSDTGYVKDDEKSSLNANAMLKSLKATNEAANEEKKKRGWETFEFIGWELPPRYNAQTHNLEWATKFNSKDGTTVNWNTRLLGRDGVMSVTLVSTEETLKNILPQFNGLLKGFSYKAGHRYAEFHQGDKVAAYGLSALVLGGAAVVAAKAGLFKIIGKYLFLMLIPIIVFFKNLWSKITKKKE